jgi:hypothetical protein
MSESSRLAAALLPHADATEVADALLSVTDIDTGVLDLKAEISETAALGQMKASWAVTATVARSISSPTVLDRLSRDSRRAVRREVARNSHTTTATLEYLHTWAVKHTDEEVLRAVVGRLDLRLLLATIIEHRSSSGLRKAYPFETLASRIASSNDPALIREAWEARLAEVMTRLTRFYRKGEFTTPTLTELFATLTHEERRHVAADCLSQGHLPVDAELASLVVDLLDHVQALESHDFQRRRLSQLALSDEAAVMFAKSEDEFLQEQCALARTTLPDEAVEALIDFGLDNVHLHLSAQHVNQLDGDRAERMVPSSAGAPSTTCENLMRSAPGELTTKARILLLELSGRALTISWLSGDTEHSPRPGEVARVVRNKKAWKHQIGRGYDAGEETTDDVIVASTSAQWASILTQPWADEFVDTLGDAWFKAAMRWPRPEQPAIVYLNSRLARAFGTDGALWRTAIQFSPTWEGGLAELIESVLLVNGRDPSQPLEPPVDASADEQLSLL